MQIAVSIAELKSFTKAAEKLGVSQPSLSKSVSLLEDELGAELFDRKNGLSLTYAGEIYISKAKNLLRLNSELNSEIRNLSSLKKGKISIGVTTLSFKFIEKNYHHFTQDLQMQTLKSYTHKPTSSFCKCLKMAL
ncbi:LysR family transcriptional regulator [Campylobacter majalis]|uniref:LysR family transcriptional regulator n=1 Tax=Campylobacter majalis TaxID=2790656 RepID=UPI003D693C3E